MTNRQYNRILLTLHKGASVSCGFILFKQRVSPAEGESEMKKEGHPALSWRGRHSGRDFWRQKRPITGLLFYSPP